MGLRAFRTGRAGAVVAWASTSWRRRAASSLSAPADSARAWRPRAPRSPATGPFPDAEASPAGEAEEHDHHQHRRGGDDVARALQAVGDGTLVVAAFFVALLDARQQHRAAVLKARTTKASRTSRLLESVTGDFGSGPGWAAAIGATLRRSVAARQPTVSLRRRSCGGGRLRPRPPPQPCNGWRRRRRRRPGS